MIRTGFRLAVAAITAAGVLSPVAAFATPNTPTDPDTSTTLAGKTVFLDPGHQGTQHSEDLGRQVDDGRGGTKDCQTTGMTSRNGVPEHTINWNVAQLVQESLQALGAEVVLSRQDDTGWGGCIDERAEAANRSGAQVAVSIHADGAPESDHGFHLIVPQLPIPDAAADRAQSGPGRAATEAVHDAYVQAGFTPADYAGAVDGIQTRSDIAGPALTEIPLVFLEMGNGANPEDAKLLESADGQLKHAIAITTGLVGYLLGVDPGGTGPQTSAPGEELAKAPAPPDTAPKNESPQATDPQDEAPPATTPQNQSPQNPVPQATTPQNAAPEAAAPQNASPQATASQPRATAPPEDTAPGTSGPQNSTARNPSAPQHNSATDELRGTAADPAPAPAAPDTVAPSGSVPNASVPGADLPGNPASAPAGTYRSAPGTYSNTDPGVAPKPQTDPETGTQNRSDDGTATTPGTGSAEGTLAGTAMQLLGPLAKSLGMSDGGLSSVLVNLAYALAATLLGPTK